MKWAVGRAGLAAGQAARRAVASSPPSLSPLSLPFACIMKPFPSLPCLAPVPPSRASLLLAVTLQAAKDAEKAAKMAKFAAKQAAAEAAKAVKPADTAAEDKKAKEKAEAEAKKVGACVKKRNESPPRRRRSYLPIPTNVPSVAWLPSPRQWGPVCACSAGQSA